MKNNSEIKSMRLKRVEKGEVLQVVIFIATLISSYLLLCFSLWLYMSYYSEKLPADLYIFKHTDTLKTEIFEKAFNKAKGCTALKNTMQQRQCERLVGRHLAESLDEEKLQGTYWPHDLMFVKQEGSNYYSLSWDGKIRNITKQLDMEVLESHWPQVVKFMMQQCNPFHTYGNYQFSCETYSTIQLDDNNKGYMLRIALKPLKNDLIYIIVIPLCIVLYLPYNIFALTRSEVGFIKYILMFLSCIIIPIILATIAASLYSKRNRKRQQKYETR